MHLRWYQGFSIPRRVQLGLLILLVTVAVFVHTGMDRRTYLKRTKDRMKVGHANDLYPENTSLINELITARSSSSPEASRLPPRQQLASVSAPQKVVILFTNKRSGSTFLGELFNQNSKAFYIFEPLFPFTRECDKLPIRRVDALEQFADCDFTNMRALYQEAFYETRHSDHHAECLQNNLCFYERHVRLLGQYLKYCQKQPHIKTFAECNLPLNSTLLSGLCRSSRLVIYKILRVCDISGLQRVIDKFKSRQDVVLKIIHLVRDPRAIVSSRIQLELDEADAASLPQVARTLCKKMSSNIIFSDSSWKAGAIQPAEYFRIRHEDITNNPFWAAEKIYKFVDETLPFEVQRWLNTSVVKERSRGKIQKSGYSTRRKAHDVLNGWRQYLNFDQVMDVQMKCASVLRMLGYTLVQSNNELKNENITLW